MALSKARVWNGISLRWSHCESVRVGVVCFVAWDCFWAAEVMSTHSLWLDRGVAFPSQTLISWQSRTNNGTAI